MMDKIDLFNLIVERRTWTLAKIQLETRMSEVEIFDCLKVRYMSPNLKQLLFEKRISLWAAYVASRLTFQEQEQLIRAYSETAQ